MNQTVDILCRARELYASAPSHAALPDNPEPGANCVIYAIIRGGCGTHKRFRAARNALAAAAGIAEGTDIPRWNAEHSTAEVLAAFDRAIAAEGLRVPPLQRAGWRNTPVLAGRGS